MREQERLILNGEIQSKLKVHNETDFCHRWGGVYIACLVGGGRHAYHPAADRSGTFRAAPLRDKASVITYTAQGDPMNLRCGEYDIYCVANQAPPPAFRAACFPRVPKPQEDMEAKERVEGKSAMAIRTDVDAPIASRKLPTPFMGATIYVRSGKDQADAHEI